MKTENSEELKHYGIPGMRWGHRKAAYQTYKKDIRKARTDNSNSKNKNISNFRKNIKDAVITNYKNKKQRRANFEESTQKAVNKYNKSIIDANRKGSIEAISKSRYGKTNSQLLVDGAVKGALGYTTLKGVSKVLTKNGHDVVGAFFDGAANGIAIGTAVGTAANVATNYDYLSKNKKKK